MLYAIIINEGPYTHQASDTAYLFARAAVELGHTIFRIFFYHDGVYNGSRYVLPPQDDRNIPDRWTKLAIQYGIDLVICVAAAQRRGVIDQDVAVCNGKDGNNIAAGFRISGLGQLIEAGIEADRLLIFGD